MKVKLCFVLMVIVTAPVRAEALKATAETIAYLRKLQTKDGGFLADAGKTRPSLRATSSALRALKYFGGTAPDKAAATAFVQRCFDKESGGFADEPGGKPDVITTAVGAMALVEVGLSTEPYAQGILEYLGANAKSLEDIRIAAAGIEALGKKPPESVKWLKEVRELQQPGGTFGRGNGIARATGGATVILLRLGGPVAEPEKVIATLNAGQRPDGAFGKEDSDKSDLDSTYRILRCYHMLKARPDTTRVLAFVDKCRNTDGGYGVMPGQPSSVGATYYAGIIRYWLSKH